MMNRARMFATWPCLLTGVIATPLNGRCAVPMTSLSLAFNVAGLLGSRCYSALILEASGEFSFGSNTLAIY